MNKGRIYFIGAVDGDVVKIGYSIKPEHRIRQIQSGNPEKLRVLHEFAGGKSVERHLHVRFGPSRRHGEWFGNAPEIRRFARHLEYCHAAKVLKIAGLDAWPSDDDGAIKALDRFYASAITPQEIDRVAADLWPDLAREIGLRRRTMPSVHGWPSYGPEHYLADQTTAAA
jgi:hypothetical protein